MKLETIDYCNNIKQVYIRLEDVVYIDGNLVTIVRGHSSWSFKLTDESRDLLIERFNRED